MIYVQKDDIKARRLFHEIAKEDEVFFNNKSPIFSSILIIKSLMKNGKEITYVFRYLNDYPSLIKTIIRCFSELVIIFLAKLSIIKIVWMCHNVDKETRTYYPNISNFRRKVISNKADIVYVMDPGLEKHYRRVFKQYEKPVIGISFGQNDVNNNTDQDLINKLKKIKSEYEAVAWSAGHYSDKTTHYHKTKDMAILNPNINFVIVAIGLPVDVFNKLDEIDNITLIEGPLNINEDEVCEYIDFYWRSYCDLSVPYSIYSAVKNYKKTVCFNEGYLSELVSSASIGIVLDYARKLENSEISPIENKIKENFFSKRNWEYSAKIIKDTLYKHE